MYILWVHLRAWTADGRVMYNETEDQEQCAFTIIIQQSVKLLLASYNNTQAFELLQVRSQYVGFRQPAGKKTIGDQQRVCSWCQVRSITVKLELHESSLSLGLLNQLGPVWCMHTCG